jgi:predicted DNA binding CopG/RHH family protein
MKKEPYVGTYLDDEERKLIETIEADNEAPKSILTHEILEETKAAARNTISEASTKVSLRLGKTDLAREKARALREGIPYQTFIKSIIHQAVSR